MMVNGEPWTSSGAINNRSKDSAVNGKSSATRNRYGKDNQITRNQSGVIGINQRGYQRTSGRNGVAARKAHGVSDRMTLTEENQIASVHGEIGNGSCNTSAAIITGGFTRIIGNAYKATVLASKALYTAILVHRIIPTIAMTSITT